MELGGSDPYLVLKDANIDKAAKICAAARLVNSGQSCIAAKRFIVEAEVYDEFLEKFTREMQSIQNGQSARQRYRDWSASKSRLTR
jgi:succinate-semialdehyde dehydrogenase/glutarate-semialdehyde dehydrogenase